MLKAVGGVVGGYVAMRLFVFVTTAISFLVMGADRVFALSSYDVTWLWLVVSLVLSLVAAIVAGAVCRRIAKGSGPVMGLATLVLIVGVVSAVPVLTASSQDSAARAEEVSVMDAMRSAKQPAWTALLLPWVGLVGVMIGGKAQMDGR
jgi:hypothetical protein